MNSRFKKTATFFHTNIVDISRLENQKPMDSKVNVNFLIFKNHALTKLPLERPFTFCIHIKVSFSLQSNVFCFDVCLFPVSVDLIFEKCVQLFV